MKKRKKKMDINSSQSETSPLAKRDVKHGRWSYFPVRYLMAILMFFGFSNLYGMRVNFSVAIVKMVEKTTVTLPNGTVRVEQDFDWGTEKQGILLSAFFWGYICTQIPGGIISGRYGGMKVFGVGVFSTSLFTILTPTVTKLWGFNGLLLLRILEGICEGFSYPSQHSFWSKWAPKYERTKLVTIGICGGYAGTVFSMPICGALADYWGWESVFYVYGCFGLFWTILWCCLASDSPEKHYFVSDTEVREIKEHRDTDDSHLQFGDIPWRKILTSIPFYAIVVAHFSENWGFYTLMTELPSYMKNILHFNLKKSGFLAGLPYLVLTVVAFSAGQVADFLRKKKYLSTVTVRKLFNSIGCLSEMIFLLATGHTDNPTAAVVFLTLAVGFGGISVSSFNVNHLDISPRYACILLGLSNTVATIPGVLSPMLTGFITTNNTAEEWRTVFYISSAIYAFSVVIFATFASGKVQSWNSSN